MKSFELFSLGHIPERKCHIQENCFQNENKYFKSRNNCFNFLVLKYKKRKNRVTRLNNLKYNMFA